MVGMESGCSKRLEMPPFSSGSIGMRKRLLIAALALPEGRGTVLFERDGEAVRPDPTHDRLAHPGH